MAMFRNSPAITSLKWRYMPPWLLHFFFLSITFFCKVYVLFVCISNFLCRSLCFLRPQVIPGRTLLSHFPTSLTSFFLLAQWWWQWCIELETVIHSPNYVNFITRNVYAVYLEDVLNVEGTSTLQRTSAYYASSSYFRRRDLHQWSSSLLGFMGFLSSGKVCMVQSSYGNIHQRSSYGNYSVKNSLLVDAFSTYKSLSCIMQCDWSMSNCMWILYTETVIFNYNNKPRHGYHHQDFIK